VTTSTATRSRPKAKPRALTLDEMIAQPGTYEIEITPAIAEQLLERNRDNRNPKQRKIEVFAEDMRNKRWRLTNQGIGVDRNGVLVDGQNRLMAGVLANTDFPTLLVTGLDPQAREVVDTGTARTFADVLRMAGKTSVMQLSGGVTLRVRYETLVRLGKPYRSFDAKVTRQALGHSAMLEYLEKTESLEEALHSLHLWRGAFPSLPASAVLAFESMALESDQDALAEFRDSIVHGANLQAGDPRLVLRNFLARAGAVRKGGPTSVYFLCVLIKGWNDWRNGLSREIIMMRENEAMPVLDEKPSWQARNRVAQRRRS
jgi:hypothetical protein